MLKEYVYQGPVSSGATVRTADGEIEVVFHPGRKTPPLPDDNEYIVALVRQGYLVSAPAAEAPRGAASTAAAVVADPATKKGEGDGNAS